MKRLARFTVVALVASGIGLVPVGAAAPLDPPPPEALVEARAIVARMKANPRGPFQRLRWFCNDGSVHPPQPYPCAELGGGAQHGEWSADRTRLAELGFHVGTLFVATPWSELRDGAPRAGRLRELALERYLVEADDGWIMRGARDYRGAVQVEDEERAGRQILLSLLADAELVRDDFLLVREMARIVPHAASSGDRTRVIRRTSAEIAEADPTFERIRIRVHGDPSEADAAATRAWIAEAEAAGKDPALVAKARALADAIRALYGSEGRRERLEAAAVAARRPGGLGAVTAEALEAAARAGDAGERAQALCGLLARLREEVAGEGSAADRLARLDLSLDVEAEALAAGLEAARRPGITRGEMLRLAAGLADGAFGSGLLSRGERDALSGPVAGLLSRTEVSAAEALGVARGLERASGWAAGAARFSFAEPLLRYTALEPRAARFVDDVLRGSTMLPLADIASRLARDAERRAGLAHSVFGEDVGGIAGLNPGVAIGTLRVVTEAEVHGEVRLDPAEIVVLPATVSELTPVAGILTVSEGNALSHVQMLARNLGIPNAVVPPAAIDALRAQAGQRVLFAVASTGSVILARADAVDATLLSGITGDARRAAADQKVPAPVPDLSVRRLLPLSELRSALSGKVVGPKAANVGELARLFPGRVAPALAIPFGLYAQHAASGDGSPKARLVAAMEGHRAGALDDAALEQAIDAVRVAVEGLSLDATTRAALEAAAAEHFGAPGSYGVFVRSDTNVEDLPQFTGAGLNKTIPHVVGFEEMLAAVPRVWASAFTRRAMAWRSRALTNPEEVYPSVLLMKSVPSDKSGVLVTADVATGGAGVTVSTAWGVGGAVDGESAETIVLRPDGQVTVVAEAKAPWRRGLAPTGGIQWLPARSGRVLEDAEVAALRAFVIELNGMLPPAAGDDGRPLPWDVEFGFASGELVLFQVRPLVERGAALADRVVRALHPKSGGAAVPGMTMTTPPDAPIMPDAWQPAESPLGTRPSPQ